MQAVQFQQVGGPEVLGLVDVEQPTPGPGQVRLRVAASAYNAADAGMRGGFLPIPVELPHIPGYDVSGTVDAIGDGVEGGSRSATPSSGSSRWSGTVAQPSTPSPRPPHSCRHRPPSRSPTRRPCRPSH